MAGDEPLSVLIFTHEYPPDIIGGLGTHVGELARGLVKAGHRAFVINTELQGEPTSGERLDLVGGEGVRVHCAPAVSRSRANDAAACALAVADRFGTPDIVHCHDHYFLAAAQRLSRERGSTVVGTVHLLPDTISPWLGEARHPAVGMLERLFVNSVTRLIAVSRSIGELCTKAHGVPSERIDVVYNAFDPTPFSPRPGEEAELAALRRELGGDAEDVVVFAGRIGLQKGIDVLLASAELVVNARPGVRFVIAGGVQRSPPYGPVWETLSEKHAGLWPHLSITGMLPRDRLAQLYRCADLAVVPSIYEPFGYAAVEPLAAGCPVLTSDAGGMAEILDFPGALPQVPVIRTAEPHTIDARAFADALLAALADRERLRASAQNGRAHVLSTFTVDRMTAETVATYRRARADRPRR